MSGSSRVMMNEGDIEQAEGPKVPACHGSASSSHEEEQRLINGSLEAQNFALRSRAFVEDPDVKFKLKGFYCVTLIMITYTTVYFTYLLLRTR